MAALTSGNPYYDVDAGSDIKKLASTGMGESSTDLLLHQMLDVLVSASQQAKAGGCNVSRDKKRRRAEREVPRLL